MRRLDDIINDVEAEIAKTGGQEKIASALPNDEDIFALAAQLEKTSEEAPQQPVEVDDGLQTLTEKVAHAIAIVDTIQNLPHLIQMADFEKQAVAKGYTEAQIEDFMAKQAKGKVPSVMKRIPYGKLGVLAGVGGAGLAGRSSGKAQGKNQGYAQALDDVNEAMKAYSI